MNELGFKLGQFLNAIDVVHAAYCIDVRGGDIPPVLLGNSVFKTAQANPLGALKLISTRWKPYHAWLKRPLSEQSKLKMATETPEDDKSKEDKMPETAWILRRGRSLGRRLEPLSRELNEALATIDSPPDERFRAELLLGYISGLPSAPKPTAKNPDSQNTGGNDT